MHPRPGLTRDAQALSSVIGAILVAALLFSLLLTVRLQFVPVWERQAEAARLEEVAFQFEELRSGVLRLTQNATERAIAEPIPLASGRSAYLGGGSGLATLRLEPAGGGANLSSPNLLILANNSRRVASLSANWTPVAGSSSVNQVGEVTDLRIRIAEVSNSQTGGIVNLTFHDASSAVLASFSIEILQAPPDLIVRQTTRAADGSPVAMVHEAFHQTNEIEPYWVNALDADTSLAALLATLPGSFSIRLTESRLSASYVIAYGQAGVAGQTVPLGTGGVVVAPYTLNASSSLLRYGSDTRYFTDQSYVLDHGAIVLEQPDGAVFRAPPSFHASRQDNTTFLLLEMPVLTGDARALSGSAPAGVNLQLQSRTAVDGMAARFQVTVPTPYPGLWTAYWSQALNATGLTPIGAAPGYRASAAPGQATLEVFGADADPAGTARDVYVLLRQSIIQVELES